MIGDEINAAALTKRILSGNAADWNEFRRNLRKRPDRVDLLDMRGVRFRSDLNLSHFDFSYCNLDGADFSTILLTSSSFSNSRLLRAKFNKAIITDCKFDHALLGSADFRNAEARGASFENSECQDTDFTEGDFTRATFIGIKGSGVRFDRAVLIFSNFYRADLTGAVFLASDLRHASLKKANLTGGSLDQAKIWELDRHDWVIKRVRCESVFLGQDGRQEEKFQSGAFERKYSPHRLFMLESKAPLDGMSLEILKSLVDQIKQKLPNMEIQLLGVQAKTDGFEVEIRADSDFDLSKRQSEKLINAENKVLDEVKNEVSDFLNSERDAYKQMLREGKAENSKLLNDYKALERRYKFEVSRYKSLLRASYAEGSLSFGEDEAQDDDDRVCHASVISFDFVNFSKMNSKQQKEVAQVMQKLLTKAMKQEKLDYHNDTARPKTHGDSFIQIFLETVFKNHPTSSSNEKYADLLQVIQFAKRATKEFKDKNLPIRCGISYGKVELSFNTAEDVLDYQGYPFIEAVRLQSSASSWEILISTRVKLYVDLAADISLKRRSLALEKGYDDPFSGTSYKAGETITCYSILLD